MAEIISFIRLDFLSLKPYLGAKKLIILAVVAILGSIILGPMGIVTIFPIIILMSTYAFAAGKDGLDGLYIILSINPKSVVIGRYFSSMLFVIIILVAFFIVSSAISFVNFGDANLANHAVVISSFFILVTILNFFNIPLLFKVGYKKGRMLVGILPMVIMLVAILVIYLLGIDLDSVSTADFSRSLPSLAFSDFFNVNDLIWLLASILAWCLSMVASMVISQKIYGRRDF